MGKLDYRDKRSLKKWAQLLGINLGLLLLIVILANI